MMDGISVPGSHSPRAGRTKAPTAPSSEARLFKPSHVRGFAAAEFDQPFELLPKRPGCAEQASEVAEIGEDAD